MLSISHDMPKIDATSPAPSTARDVKIGRCRYSREGLETAWLLLEQHDEPGTRAALGAAVEAMKADGWETGQAIELARAASGWTGQVVHACANCPCS